MPRRFEYTLLSGQQLKYDFSGDEPAKIHVEVDAGQILLTTKVNGREQQTILPQGRAWSTGDELRRDIDSVTIEIDPDTTTLPTITYDIGPDAGEPNSGAKAALDIVKQGTLTDRSGNLTAGNTSEEMMAANTVRRYLLIVNIHATEDLWVRFGGSDAAVDGEGSILISPDGGSLVYEGSFIPTDAVQVIATTISHAWTAYEG